MIKFPDSLCLNLEKNPHKLCCQTVEEWSSIAEPDFISEESFFMCIKYDTIWCLQWWPNTPNMHYKICSHSLELLIEYIKTDWDEGS